MNKEEMEKLFRCSEATKMSRSEVIRAGIDYIDANLDKFTKK